MLPMPALELMGKVAPCTAVVKHSRSWPGPPSGSQPNYILGRGSGTTAVDTLLG